MAKDPKNCWNCGKKGVAGTGSQMKCTTCDVTWYPYGKVKGS